ncbi:36643_t:CDS:2 [Gigaspora margarita]|uniref:36643_t:CDS:1 n=1 Tax=Gigaspora margarita TaxID=4874 RepID=A0ABN7WFH3_GIGMA|nr:36643_t:CDS:2 [Gigaspora margarita]
MARDFLVIPASSVASEQMFSYADRIIDECHTLLDLDTIAALMCQRNWLNMADKFETEELYSKKIDRKLSRPQATNTQQNTKVLTTKEENVLRRNKCIATWLKLYNPGLVTIIRKTNEIYSNIAYKQLAENPLSQEELNFIKFRDKIELSTVKVIHITREKQKKLAQKKKLLVGNECGTIDYGLEELLLSETTKELTTIYRKTETTSSQKKTTRQ